MKKYRVYGTTTVTVTKEVWANNEDEALEKAYDALPCLTAYCGNGGGDKLIGVEGYNETVEAFDDIEYNDTRELEDDPDYFECPDCKKHISIFGESNIDKTANEFNIKTVAKLPINPEFALLSDSGKIEEFSGDYLEELAEKISKI